MELLKKTSISTAILTLLLLFLSVAVVAQPAKDNPGKSKSEHIEQINNNAQTKGQQGKDNAAEVKDKVHELKANGKSSKDKEHIKGEDHPGKGKDKGKIDRPETDDDLDEMNENADNDGPKKDKPKIDKENNGHGYGKDKGDLTGREFGQQRAAEAKLNKETKAKELNNSISTGENKLKEAQDKIKAVREKMEKEKTSGQLSESAFKEKAQKIEAAEKLLQSLREKLENAKQLGNDQ